MSEIKEKLNEANKLVEEIEKLFERDPNLEKEKPGVLMQKFYLAMRDVQNYIKELTLDERSQFDLLNESYKNLSGAIARKVTAKS